MSLGKRLRERRQALGLTQVGLAKQLGVTHSTISQIESGKIKRTFRVFELSRALGVPAHWLAAGESAAATGNTAHHDIRLQRLIEKLRQLPPDAIGKLDQLVDAYLADGIESQMPICVQPIYRQTHLGGNHA